MLKAGPATTRVVMMMRRDSRPGDVVVIDGRATAAQQRAARHRPHTVTVNIAETRDIMIDNGRLQCKHAVM